MQIKWVSWKSTQESLTTNWDADNFKNFKDLYNRSLPIGKDLSSAKAKSATGKKCDKLYESFRVIQNNLWNACIEEPQINKWFVFKEFVEVQLQSCLIILLFIFYITM